MPPAMLTAPALAATPSQSSETTVDSYDTGVPLQTPYFETPPLNPGSVGFSDLTRDAPIILVIGLTGAGKSRFIRAATDLDKVRVGDNSCTQLSKAVQSANPFREIDVSLVDTPGFDDTFREDIKVLQEVLDRLEETYQRGIQISGILYLHRITDDRVPHGLLRNLDLLRRYCGDDVLSNIRLVTTNWDLLVDKSEGERKEEVLCNKYWRYFIEGGSQMYRFQNTYLSAWEIINSLPMEGKAASIQKEMVDQPSLWRRVVEKVLFRGMLTERERAERELIEREQTEIELVKRERTDREHIERERYKRGLIERLRAERERIERERYDRELIERAQVEGERIERMLAERACITRERAEMQRVEREQEERERVERDERERQERKREKMEKEKYQMARSLILRAVDLKLEPHLGLPSLRGLDAQSMVDFLNQVLDDDDPALRPEQRKHVLHLFTKLIKAAQIPPKSLKLTGVTCDLSVRPEHEGGFGYIYRGESEGRTVCVKVVRLYQGDTRQKALRAHAGELALWAHVSHPNILPFYGIFPSKEEVPRICIVSPWMVNGSLASYLNTNAVSPPTRILLLLDIISGLGYLHDLDIIHSDLKANNVLVSNSGRAKLADLGTSIVAITNAGTTTADDFSGTANWMAPELLAADIMPPPTRATDIWAFGCTCYEVLAGEIPFKQYGRVSLIAAFIRKNIDLSQLRPTEDAGMWPLMQRCLALEGAERPTAEEVRQEIAGLGVHDSRSPIVIEFAGAARKSTSIVNYDRVHAILSR